MAGFLPTINGGYSLAYPCQRNIAFTTDVATFKNGSEQRFQKYAVRAAFSLQYAQLSLPDRNAIEAWFSANLGVGEPTSSPYVPGL
jgi:hypothetical protein